jgi:hypothetical protein
VGVAAGGFGVAPGGDVGETGGVDEALLAAGAVVGNCSRVIGAVGSVIGASGGGAMGSDGSVAVEFPLTGVTGVRQVSPLDD